MRNEIVEIYADTTNAAIMRHPGRRFPGLLIQGDTLYTLYKDVHELCMTIGGKGAGYKEANDLRNRLGHLLDHYKKTLGDHGIPLPFSD